MVAARLSRRGWAHPTAVLEPALAGVEASARPEHPSDGTNRGDGRPPVATLGRRRRRGGCALTERPKETAGGQWRAQGTARPAIAAGVATAVVATALAWAVGDGARAFHWLETSRPAGADRIRSAVAVPTRRTRRGLSRALIAHAGGFADALAAALLTRTPDGPLLLTHHV